MFTRRAIPGVVTLHSHAGLITAGGNSKPANPVSPSIGAPLSSVLGIDAASLPLDVQDAPATEGPRCVDGGNESMLGKRWTARAIPVSAGEHAGDGCMIKFVRRCRSSEASESPPNDAL